MAWELASNSESATAGESLAVLVQPVECDQPEQGNEVNVVLGKPGVAGSAASLLLAGSQPGQQMNEDLRHAHVPRDGEPDAAPIALKEAQEGRDGMDMHKEGHGQQGRKSGNTHAAATRRG